MTPAQKKRLHEIPPLLKHLADEARDLLEKESYVANTSQWHGGLLAEVAHLERVISQVESGQLISPGRGPTAPTHTRR
jgi:hypothetical protein